MSWEQQEAEVPTTAANGFTLIELLIVLAIVGILSVIAYPSYSNYVARGKIIEGHSLLADYRVRIEQYYQDNRNYAAANGPCGADVPSSEHQYFTLTCVASSDENGNAAQAYVATATSNGGQGLGAAGTYVFTINQQNVKQTTSFPGVSSLPKNCWLVKGSEC
ncbi:MAG TPA: type IV pilin protein [Gallionella sp.]|nr:type IV pilin protein [Gallionella sp.]